MSWGDLAEAVRPWVSTGALVGLFGLVVKLWLDNKKLNLDSEGGIRDHYAKEVAGLRAQVLAVQDSADLRAQRAETRYNEAMEAADTRHKHCEEECERLREMVRGLERQIAAIHKSSIRLFEPKSSLDPETKEQMRSLEQGVPPSPPESVGVLILDQPCPPFPDVDATNEPDR